MAHLVVAHTRLHDCGDLAEAKESAASLEDWLLTQDLIKFSAVNKNPHSRAITDLKFLIRQRETLMSQQHVSKEQTASAGFIFFFGSGH